MAQAIVNDKKFEVQAEGNGVLINQQPLAWDLLKISDRHYHILYENRTYSAELIKSERDTKTFTFKINGRLYTVNLKDKFDLMLEKMGIANAGGAKLNNLKAPMPGLIVDLKVKAGDTVKVGDPLLILEAMKMENVLKSPGEGVIKTVKVKKGDSVEKGHILLEF
ncbi:MAG: acetyl-CoA carboxylase biotin carboxyl carrier protein subunit [Flammeovirgaceae bacterium]